MKVPACLLCRRLTTDGSVSASQVDKQKLKFFFAHLYEEKLQEVDDTDRICYFCIWRAQRDSYIRQDIFFTMAWWPTRLEMDASAKVLRKYFMEEKIEQSWVKLKLEYIDVPKCELNDSVDDEMKEKDVPEHSSRKNVPMIHPRFNLEAKLQPRQRRAKGQCLECPYSTKYASHLRMHVARIHMPLTLRCDLCTSMFAIPQTLNQHMRNVHTFRKCSLCKQDVTNGGFGEHKKRRKCRKCNAEFACAGLNRNHLH
ncbi:zinc finger protein 555-like [Cloeon dipterum]|uniref:zinc finger protein 555-like n=1 Tax=Cloeon dipterum TaxID=197152 RepID=UPI0032204CFF